VPLDAVELLDVDLKSVNVGELFRYLPDWACPVRATARRSRA
jgi:hypothetical protein